MFKYYLFLGLRSLRRNPALTALMVLTLAIGVAASVSTLTILHVMSNDPIPQKSTRLFAPVIDARPLTGYTPDAKAGPDLLTYRDAQHLLASGQGERRTALFGVRSVIEAPRKELGALRAKGIATTRDFFGMMETPFLYGQAWGEREDSAGADVIVLGRAMSEKLFGNVNPVGQRLMMSGQTYQVVGVLDHWRPLPRFYNVRMDDPFGEVEDVLIPFASAVKHESSIEYINCDTPAGPGYQGALDSECLWIAFWFEAKSSASRAELSGYLDAYMGEQAKLGRFTRHAKAKLFDVAEMLEYRHVVGNESKVQAWLAFGFFLLCLINTIGLLLAKFSVRAAEVGIRRALGASRRTIFAQFLTETAVVGLVGGLLGLALAYGALLLIARQSKKLGVVAHMDLSMLALTVALAVLAAMLAGLLPTWRACRVTPALQLKSQ